MKYFSLPLIALLLCFSSVYADMNLSVHDAIDLALENNETYLSAKQELEKAKNQVREVRASAFPQLSAEVNILRNWELPSFVLDFEGEQMTIRTGSYYNWISSFTLTQPIYNGGAVFSAWSAAKLYRKYTIQQLEVATRQLKLDVIEAFYGVVMTDELRRVAAQSVDLAQASLDVVKKMEVQGTVSEFEVLMAEVRLANFKPQLIEANAASRLARESLNNMIGLELNREVDLIFDMDSTLYLMPDLDLDSLKTSVIEKRPELMMMRLQTKMLGKAVSVAKSGYRPKINFLTTLQYQAQYDNDKFPGSNDWLRSYYSGINISIPIFDSWRTPAKVKQARIELKQSKLSETGLEDNLKLDIERNWWNYQQARESLAAQGHAVEMAKRGLDIARVRYENGVGTQLELFEAEVSLAAAENNRVTAFHNLVTGYASLMKAIGEEQLIR
ncbi:MAG: TolC family protein [candidate division Zixibacteria bacterium]|nr:TolC family protein [candidate division Zixibacteria bacterium]